MCNIVWEKKGKEIDNVHANGAWCVQVEYPEFVQIMTTKLDKQNEDAYAPKDDSMHKTMILDKLLTQI